MAEIVEGLERKRVFFQKKDQKTFYLLARIIASGFGSGYAPRAAGTAGSLVALIIGAGLLAVSPIALAVAALMATFGGVWAIGVCQASDDPGWVTVDEFAGQWITMLALSRPTLGGLAAAFALFRFLDIAKPGPVAWADQQKTAAGVMGDDVIAGGLAFGILWATQSHWPLIFG